MLSNEDCEKTKMLPSQSDNIKSSQHQKGKNKSSVSKRPTNRPKDDETIEKPHRQIANNCVKEFKQFTTTNDCATIDRQTDSKQIMDKTTESPNSTISKNKINSRYQLNSTNYIINLHRILIKECEDNLLDLNLLNATLDDESLTNVTHRTLKAIKV